MKRITNAGPTARRNVERGQGEVLAKVEDPIERAVHLLNAICTDTTLEFSLAVGRLIVDTFYGGDLGRWRSRGPKTCSFRKLAQHAGALYRSVAIYELCQRLNLTGCQRVSATHLRLVLALPEVEQRRLLCAADVNRWPARRLEQEVAAISPARARGGPRRKSTLVITVAALERCLNQRACLDARDDAAPDPTPEVAAHLMAALLRVRHGCETLERRTRCYLLAAQTEPPPPLSVNEVDEARLSAVSPRGNSQ
jgi:hypothetical protein